MLALWQTAMLRLSRLRVVDEVENGLAYYRYTFLGEVPRLYQTIASHFATGDEMQDPARLPAFFRMGSWIGGDRDGNPYVTADTLRYAIRAQCGVAIGHYLDEVHRLGAELSLSTRLVKPTEALIALAGRASDANAHRQDEPYRQALIGVYARLGDDGAQSRASTAGKAPARGSSSLRDARRHSKRILR